jgi:hypothetical protein
MAARDVHLVDADVDEAILKHNGIIVEEEKERKLINMKTKKI